MVQKRESKDKAVTLQIEEQIRSLSEAEGEAREGD
jgi:hypothetical protein